MREDKSRGRFVWYDLMTSDTTAASGFYTDLIGWGTTEWEGADMQYTMWTNNEAPLGGIMDLPEEAKQAGAPPHWLAYVAVPDTDATVALAAENGGKVLVPATDIPTVGRFAVLQDPYHAVFAIFTPSEEAPGHDEPPKVGEFSWHELATNDHAAAFEFYSKLFGWEKTGDHDMGELGIYQMYGRSGSETPLGGMFNKPSEMPPGWLLYLRIEDMDQAVAKVKAAGGKVLKGPMEVPGGDMVTQCMDPQGAAFALHSSKG